MSKRGAGAQITREALEYGNSDDDEQSLRDFGIASTAVMSKRKIAMPKRKMAFSAPVHDAGESKMASTFSFTNKPAIGSNTSNGLTTLDDKSAKLKALNNQFTAKISEVLQKDPMADVTPMFAKYNKYIKFINDITTNDTVIASDKPKSTPTDTDNVFKPSFPAMKPMQFGGISQSAPIEVEDADADESSEESSSDDEKEKKEIKVEGPTFSLQSKPTIKDSVFAFGAALPKKVEAEKDSDDSEDEVEIKGPQFTFAGSVKSDIFKLKENSNIEKKEESPKPSFFFGTKPTGTKESKNKVIENPFTSPSSTFAETSKPAFSFGVKPATAELKSDSKPSFSFGKQATTEDKPAAPSFCFGATSVSTRTDESTEKSSKPSGGFSFGISSTKKDDEVTETSKPSGGFTFGLGSSSTKSSTEPETTTKISAGFSFSRSTPEEATSATDSAKPSSGFSFGISKPEVPSTDNDSTKPSGGFSFGTSNSTESKESEKKPDFSFKFGETPGQKNETESKPAFSFSNSSNTESKKSETKPAFSFGASITSSAPSFSFEKTSTSTSTATSSAFSTSASDKPVMPSGGFKFALPFEQKASSVTIPETQKEEASEVTNEENPQENVEESLKPMQTQNGEENEAVLFTQRAKLMVFNPETKAYDSKGVGEMKLLQMADDKSKVRLLCRSDGMGHILLNSSIVKTFEFSPLTEENENLVKTPTVDADGKLITYVVKFKQKSDGRLFIKSIEDAKKDM